jgi:hypothetical protein
MTDPSDPATPDRPSSTVRTACGVTVKLWHGDDCDGCKRIKYLIVRGDSPLQSGERIRRDHDGDVFTLDRVGIDPVVGEGWFLDQGGFISHYALSTPGWTILPREPDGA